MGGALLLLFSLNLGSSAPVGPGSGHFPARHFAFRHFPPRHFPGTRPASVPPELIATCKTRVSVTPVGNRILLTTVANKAKITC